MPDLKRCKVINGVQYCWDRETKRIAVVQLQFPNPKTIPWEVVAEFITEADDLITPAVTDSTGS